MPKLYSKFNFKTTHIFPLASDISRIVRNATQPSRTEYYTLAGRHWISSQGLFFFKYYQSTDFYLTRLFLADRKDKTFSCWKLKAAEDRLQGYFHTEVFSILVSNLDHIFWSSYTILCCNCFISRFLLFSACSFPTYFIPIFLKTI